MALKTEYIKDANKPLQLKITTRDVNAARRKQNNLCAAARCLLRMEGVDEAIVNKTRTLIRKGSIWTRYVTPISLQMELVAFDRGGRFEPGEHFLLPVPHYERPTGKRQGSNKDKKTGRQGTRTYHRITNIRPTARV